MRAYRVYAISSRGKEISSNLFRTKRQAKRFVNNKIIQAMHEVVGAEMASETVRLPFFKWLCI